MSEIMEDGGVTVVESDGGADEHVIVVGRRGPGVTAPSGPGDDELEPFDHVMAGLGACTALTVRMYAEHKEWPLTHVTVKVRHIRPGPLARHKFMREITLEGALDEKQRLRLLDIAERCPVHRMLQSGATIETTSH